MNDFLILAAREDNLWASTELKMRLEYVSATIMEYLQCRSPWQYNPVFIHIFTFANNHFITGVCMIPAALHVYVYVCVT